MVETPATSFVTTSDNLILQALRRTGDELEVRLVECLGAAGNATVTVSLPHEGAAMTNLIGEERKSVTGTASGDGASYTFQVRPQQIVTLRLKTAKSVAPVEALRTFDPIVPAEKRFYTRAFDRPELEGHPPIRVDVPEWIEIEEKLADKNPK